jgi:hypothetical protein
MKKPTMDQLSADDLAADLQLYGSDFIRFTKEGLESLLIDNPPELLRLARIGLEYERATNELGYIAIQPAHYLPLGLWAEEHAIPAMDYDGTDQREKIKEALEVLPKLP